MTGCTGQTLLRKSLSSTLDWIYLTPLLFFLGSVGDRSPRDPSSRPSFLLNGVLHLSCSSLVSVDDGNPRDPLTRVLFLNGVTISTDARSSRLDCWVSLVSVSLFCMCAFLTYITSVIDTFSFHTCIYLSMHAHVST